MVPVIWSIKQSLPLIPICSFLERVEEETRGGMVSVRMRVQRIEAGPVVWRLLWPADTVFAHITIHYSVLSSRLSVIQKKTVPFIPEGSRRSGEETDKRCTNKAMANYRSADNQHLTIGRLSASY